MKAALSFVIFAVNHVINVSLNVPMKFKYYDLYIPEHFTPASLVDLQV